MTNAKTLGLTLARLASGGALLVWATVACLGCDSATAPSDDDRLMQTESPAYQLQPDWIGLSAEIPYTFTNRTGRPVYLVNCNGSFSIHLEREDGDGWKAAWSPVVPDCLSPAIVIGANTLFHDTLHVWGAPPDSSHYGPNFDLDDPRGVYRIVWDTGLTSFDANAYPFGPLIRRDWRVSNRFTLRR